MARYDRIARLDSPPRGDTFTGWLMVRDLEDRERDADLGRRARLRFLAVRLLYRILRAGSSPDRDSVRQQAEAIREELGQLPSRDPDRERLGDLLKQAGALDLEDVVRSALEMAEAAHYDGHPFAAEEWYRTAHQLARAHQMDRLAEAASAGLASVDGREVGAGA